MPLTVLALALGCDRTPDGVDRPQGGHIVDPTETPGQPGVAAPPAGTGSGPTTDDGTGATLIVPEPWWPEGWLRVRVDDHLEGARVLVSGLEATTDNWGLAELIGLPAGATTVEVQADGYPTMYGALFQTVDHPAAAWFSAENAVGWTFDAGVGGTFADGATTVDVPAFALVDGVGAAVTGAIDASVLGLTESSQAAVLPSLETGDGAALLGLAAGWIAFESEGVPLGVATPISMTLPMVPVSGLAFGPGVPKQTWVYDATLGQWLEGPEAVAGVDTFTLSADRSGWWVVAEHRRVGPPHLHEPARRDLLRMRTLDGAAVALLVDASAAIRRGFVHWPLPPGFVRRVLRRRADALRRRRLGERGPTHLCVGNARSSRPRVRGDLRIGGGLLRDAHRGGDRRRQRRRPRVLPHAAVLELRLAAG